MAIAWLYIWLAVSVCGGPGAGVAVGPFAAPVAEVDFLDEPPLHDILQPNGVEAEALVLGENSGISYIKVIPGNSLSFLVIPNDS